MSSGDARFEACVEYGCCPGIEACANTPECDAGVVCGITCSGSRSRLNDCPAGYSGVIDALANLCNYLAQPCMD